jgi:hypothetical protein
VLPGSQVSFYRRTPKAAWANEWLSMRPFLFLLAVALILGLAMSTYLLDTLVSAVGLAFLAVLAIVGLVVAAAQPDSTREPR